MTKTRKIYPKKKPDPEYQCVMENVTPEVELKSETIVVTGSVEAIERVFGVKVYGFESIKPSSAGFSSLELLIVVAITALLCMVAAIGLKGTEVNKKRRHKNGNMEASEWRVEMR